MKDLPLGLTKEQCARLCARHDRPFVEGVDREPRPDVIAESVVPWATVVRQLPGCIHELYMDSSGQPKPKHRHKG